MKVVRGTRTCGTRKLGARISSSSRDPGGLRAGALHIDEQWLACAIQRTETSQRAAAAQVKSTPMMDFRQFKHHVDIFTASSDVCAAKLREWQQKGSNVSLLDLKRAYLLVRVYKTLSPFQTVKIGGQRYCLTLLGFRLNVAPLIMKAIVSAVLSQEEDVGCAASAYIDICQRKCCARDPH